jgi:hypothetical protein
MVMERDTDDRRASERIWNMGPGVGHMAIAGLGRKTKGVKKNAV